MVACNKLRPYHARVNEALVNNCAIVYDSDEEFGTLPVADTQTVSSSEPLRNEKIRPQKLAHLLTEQKQ